jgi:flagellar protein FlgJ
MKPKDLTSYTDIQSINSIKVLNRSNEDKAIEKVAREFESFFIHMMIKEMRKAEKTISSGGIFDSSAHQTYREMLDHQLSLDLSKSQGIGISEILIEQLKKTQTPT